MLKIPKYQDVRSRGKAIKYTIMTVLVIYSIQGLFCLVLGSCLLSLIYMPGCRFLRELYVEDILMIIAGTLMLFLATYSNMTTFCGRNGTQLRYFIAVFTAIVLLELTAAVVAHINWNKFDNFEFKTGPLIENIFLDKSVCARNLRDRFSCCALGTHSPPCGVDDRKSVIMDSCVCNTSDTNTDCRQVQLSCSLNETITIFGTSCADAILETIEYQTTFIRISSSLIILVQLVGFLTIFVYVSRLSRSRLIAQYIPKSHLETDIPNCHI